MATPSYLLQAVTAGLEQVDQLVDDQVVALFEQLADLQPSPRGAYRQAALEWEERRRVQAQHPDPPLPLLWWHRQALCNLPEHADLDFVNPWAHSPRDPARSEGAGRGRAATQLEDCQAVCAVCPVREPCLEYGQQTGSLGVWGGVPHRGT